MLNPLLFSALLGGLLTGLAAGTKFVKLVFGQQQYDLFRVLAGTVGIAVIIYVAVIIAAPVDPETGVRTPNLHPAVWFLITTVVGAIGRIVVAPLMKG